MQQNFTVDDLVPLIEARGKAVLERFNKTIADGVSDPKLLTILQFVKEYWKDNFRPALASLCCTAVGGSEDATNDVGLMVTMISAGAGIHDDIIDKSYNKHFRMTVLGQYGLDYSLLVGDLLIVKGWAAAYEIARKSPENMRKILEIFGNWTTEVCEAEFTEVECIRNVGTGIEKFEQILRQSMSDTRACATLGAIIGNGSEREIQALTEYGTELGFLLRLANDVTDFTNREFNLKCRLENESIPLPILYAAKASKDNSERLQEIFSKSSISIEDQLEIFDLTIESGALNYVLRKARESKVYGDKRLLELRDSKAKAALSLILEKAFMDISSVIR